MVLRKAKIITNLLIDIRQLGAIFMSSTPSSSCLREARSTNLQPYLSVVYFRTALLNATIEENGGTG